MASLPKHTLCEPGGATHTLAHTQQQRRGGVGGGEAARLVTQTKLGDFLFSSLISSNLLIPILKTCYVAALPAFVRLPSHSPSQIKQKLYFFILFIYFLPLSFQSVSSPFFFKKKRPAFDCAALAVSLIALQTLRVNLVTSNTAPLTYCLPLTRAHAPHMRALLERPFSPCRRSRAIRRRRRRYEPRCSGLKPI